MKYNYHTHCYMCDGYGKPADYVKKAIELEYKALGFSCHCPVPFKTDWTMRQEILNDYLNKIRHLKKKYADKIQIYLGLEVDYIEGIDVLKKAGIDRNTLDYIIGSVHFLYNDKNENLTVDGSYEEAIYILNDKLNGNKRMYFKKYYELYKKMIGYLKPEILGHIDLLMKNNKDGVLFDPSSSEYAAEVKNTLLTAKKQGGIIEANTGAMARGYLDVPYPEKEVIEECARLDIPMMINSDAHRPEWLNYGYEKAAGIMKECGIKHKHVLYDNIWQKVEI